MAHVVTILALLGVVLVLFLAAVLATREGPVMADAPQDAADVALPDGPVQPGDVQALRFGMAPRGYRMSEVDRVLDRLAAELADRDRRLAELTGGAPSSASSRVTSTDPAVAGSPPPARAPAVDVAAASTQDDGAPAAAAHSGGDLPPGPRH